MPDFPRFWIHFDDEQVASVIRVPADVMPKDALDALQLPPYSGVIVLEGSGLIKTPNLMEATQMLNVHTLKKLEEELFASVQRFFATGLMPFAEKNRLLIVDGGTQAGAHTAMGNARRETKCTFPKVGVCPVDAVAYPGGPPQGPHRWPLDAGHSHFVLIDGKDFGEESNLFVELASAGGKPGMALVVSGGIIVQKEVQMHARQGNTIVAVKGTGRTADALADPDHEFHSTLPAGTRIEIVDLEQPETLTAVLEKVFGQAEAS